MSFRKLFQWAVAIFLIYYLATQPVAAANAMHALAGVAVNVASSLATFVNNL